LAALEDGDAFDGPAVGDLAFYRGVLKEFWERVDVSEVEDVGAVEERRTVVKVRVEAGGIVARVVLDGADPGLCSAIHAQRDVRLYSVGGVWHWLDYPGVLRD
jgi:hypothetical protein